MVGYTFEGKLNGKDLKIGIVVSRFNESITKNLLVGAANTLKLYEVNEQSLDVAWVPGAFEIPIVAKKMARFNKYDAIIALGAVVRGSTSHYDYVCNAVSEGVRTVSLEMSIPIIFGVLTTENMEQAIERSRIDSGNKGSEAAASAIEMANLDSQLQQMFN